MIRKFALVANCTRKTADLTQLESSAMPSRQLNRFNKH